MDENQDDLRVIEGWEIFVLDNNEGAIIEFKTFDSKGQIDSVPIGFSTEILRRLHAELEGLIQHLEQNGAGRH